MASYNQRFKLPALPWPKNALEKGGISSETIDYHYGKHHVQYILNFYVYTIYRQYLYILQAGYVRKLNAADKEGKVPINSSIEQLVLTANGKIFNLAAQIYNHTFYWQSIQIIFLGALQYIYI